MRLFAAARRRPAALAALLGILAVAGVGGALRLPASIFPSVTFPIVKVIADAGEEPAARMMPTVTRPLEEAIRRVPGVRLVRSITSRGSTEIVAEFAWGTDMAVALQRTQGETERIRPELPPGTSIDVEWMNPAIFPILGYALTSETRSQAYLRQLAEFTLKPALLRIPGVSEVQIQGGRRREFQVRLDAHALAGRGLTPGDVIAAIRRTHTIDAAGLTERNHELYLALVDGRVHDLAGLSAIAVPVPGGPPATLADLGEIRTDDEITYIRTTADGRAAVLVNVVRQPAGNTVAIARGVERLLQDRPDLLPRDVRWSTFYDQARFVSASVRGTRDAILIGMLLAAGVLFAFLRSARLTLIAALAIPLTVSIVGVALSAAGQTVNLMTLAGVAAAIGLIADDAIVVIENIAHARARGSLDPARDGLAEIFPALVGSSLSTTVILVPFALLPGVTGAFFRPLALTLALALLVSFAVAALAVPVAAARFGRDTGPAPGAGPGRRVRALEAAYQRATALFIGRPGPAVAALVGLLLGGYALYRVIGTDFLPEMDEGAIVLDYWTPPGTSLTDTDHMLREVERELLAVPDVSGYSRRTGTQLGFFITEPNRGDYLVNLKPRRRRRPVDDVIDDLRQRIAALEPAVHTDFGQVLEDNIGDLTGGEPQPIDLKIVGEDQQVLEQKAREVARIVSGVPGVADVFDGIVIAGPALDVRVDPRALARYGLTTDDVHAAVEPALVGTVVDRIRVGDRMYDLRVLTAPAGDLGDLRVHVGTGRGGLVPLSALATIATGAPEAEIDREDLQTYVGVTARLSGRDLGSAIADIKARLARQLALPPGVTIRYGGQYGQQQRAFRDLLLILVMSLALVGVIVLFEFGDWRAPIATGLCAIAVLGGVLLALVVTGQTLNISSYVGAIMMVGIVGENAIFVIDEARRELAAGGDVATAWARATRRRARPVAMTVLATTLALAPLALALGQGAQLMQPLAIAVIGGFVLSGPIALFVLPGLYRLLDPQGRLGRTAR